MLFITLSDDVRQLFIHSEALKDKINSLGVSTGVEQIVKRKAHQHIENIQAEILCFNEFLSGLLECINEDDLNFLLERSEEDYE